MLQSTKEIRGTKNYKSLYNFFLKLKDLIYVNLQDSIYFLICICLSRSSIIGQLFPCSIAFLCAYYYIKGPSIVALLLSVFSIISVKLDVKYIAICIFIYIYYVSIKNKKRSNLFVDIICFASILFVINCVIMMYNGYKINMLLINVFEALFIISLTFIIREVIFGIKKGSFNIDSTACLLSVIFISILGFKEIQLLSFKVLIFMTFFTIIFVSAYISSFAGMVLGFAFGLFNFTTAAESAFYMLALGFGGVCCGIIKKKYKPLSGFVFIVISTLILLYFDNITLYKDNIKELGMAIIVYTIISFSFNDKLNKFSSVNNFNEKKTKDVVVKLNNLSSAINELSSAYNSFGNINKKIDFDIEVSVNNVYGKICLNCPQMKKCWRQNYNKTYYAIVKTASNIVKNKNMADGYLKNECENYKEIIKEIYITVKNKENIVETTEDKNNNTFLSHLKETSSIISDAAKEIQYIDIKSKEAKININEITIKENIIIKNIEITEMKNILSAIVTISTRKTMSDVCPIITNAINAVTGIYMKCTEKIVSDDKYFILRFNTLKKINAKAYYSKLTKENSQISGDNYTFGVSNNRFYGVLCDGMGTGLKACDESKNAIRLLAKLLDANFNELQMINTLNSLLLLKLENDRYVTLDFSIIDYLTHELRIYKAGAAQTYVISNGKVKKLQSGSLPIGILDSFECYQTTINISSGDTVIMMTDGVVDSTNGNELKSLDNHIDLIKNKDPQSLANAIITYAVKGTTRIIDDMTVLVIKIL
ncbi:SpoIIE family protein phosphatase [Sedimentibacter sp. zth1]|uniref:SpoIIE family protein phosphatase n=1 Tax=Sedimentibacter sp. zth1 TaxID=2816908 RepID=UPI001A90F1A5|nr:SpoIIE family protein phosphatase [Sedimentibacter sp. zth1]QSX05500.1 SpoIIE family protein phosphatase [Sedimentibacter sp. zth1]